jgi:hypothetical protein
VGVTRIDPEQVGREALEALALNADLDLQSPAALAESLRRAASFLCPTTPRALTRAVRDVLRGLPGVTSDTDAALADIVDLLVANGDLLELPVDDGTRSRRQLFLGPPAFVPFRQRSALLVGIRPEGAPLIGDDLLGAIEYISHVRMIRSVGDESVIDLLGAEGLIEFQLEHWLQAPRQATPGDVVGFYQSRLEAAGPSGDIDGVQVIDPVTSVSFYRGRWRTLKPRDDGHFVARRPQAFGADLWCFAQVVGGHVSKLLDLPLQNSLSPGADEAWRLQAALDAVAAHPQRLRVRAEVSASIIDFFSPVPSWLQRRLDVVGRAVPRGSGALFSYSVSSDQLGDEIRYLGEMMWLSADGAIRGTQNAS